MLICLTKLKLHYVVGYAIGILCGRAEKRQMEIFGEHFASGNILLQHP